MCKSLARPIHLPYLRLTVTYQPNGERGEVRHRAYLRFRNGAVYGIGYEDARKLCKISGKYKLNKRTNQIVLVLECK